MNTIAFSIDSNCISRPELIGVNIDKLKSLDKMKLFSDAFKFRSYVSNSQEDLEVWILSSDNIEAINLAAAIKADKPNYIVKLISFTHSGSLQSRADAAKIDEVINIATLKKQVTDLFKKDKNNNKNVEANLENISTKKNKEEQKSKYISKHLKNNSKSKKLATVIPVMSASGGAGKSAVSVACAVLSQVSGLKTLVIDADFQFGDISILMGEPRPLRIDQLIAENDLLYSLKPHNNSPCVLGPPLMAELSEKILEEFPSTLDLLRNYFDVIVINTGSLWGELQAILLERCSKTLFLVDQRPTSINATNRAIDLCGRCGIAIGSVLFVINKCSKTALFTSVDVSCALRGTTVAEASNGGMDVDEFLAYGKPLELLKSKNPFYVSVWSIIKDILPKKEVETGPKHAIDLNQKSNKKGLFKLFGKKSA